MITPTPQQKEYYVKYRSIAELTANVPPSPAWIGKIVEFPNGDQVTCNNAGTLWEPVGTALSGNTAAVIDSTSPINGNPTDLDTPAEIAARIQAQNAQIAALTAALAQKMDKAVYDADNNNLVDTTDNIENHAGDYSSIFLAGLIP
jgi:hypothetical protein